MLCIGFAAEHWDMFDVEQGFMLGLRSRGSRREGGSSRSGKHGSAQGCVAVLLLLVLGIWLQGARSSLLSVA